jgi:molybdenum cofactor cytidylyltransferase
VLAAGRSTRMGGPNKLLAELGGKPLVRIVTEQALASKAPEVIVVTGHQAERGRAGACRPRSEIRAQSGFRRRACTSVKAGIAAVPANADGAMVCLGDMPQIDAQLIDRLIEAFAIRTAAI